MGQGPISSFSVKLRNGRTAVYHKLQYWANGRNHSVHIPEDRLAEFERAVKGGRRVMKLVGELGRADVAAILAPGPKCAKKKAYEAIRGGAAAFRELINRAIDSIERDGIACTSLFEQVLFDTMNGVYRELAGALLTSTVGERNGGTLMSRGGIVSVIRSV